MGILSSGCANGIGASSSAMDLGMVLLCIYKLVVPFENVATCGSRFGGSSWGIREHGGNSKAQESGGVLFLIFLRLLGRFVHNSLGKGGQGKVGYTS